MNRKSEDYYSLGSEGIQSKIINEYDRQAHNLRKRNDFIKEYDYFLDIILLSIYPDKYKARFNKPIIGFYCLPGPLEIFDSLGLFPVRLWGCSSHMHKFSSGLLPAVTCPIIKSCVGSFFSEQSMERACDVIVLPNTCSCKTKALETINNKSGNFYFMDVPRSKDTERGRKRWVEEVYALKKYLEKYTGKSCDRKNILSSISKYTDAVETFKRLVELRRNRSIPGTWAIVLANAFMLDEVLSWTSKVNELINNYKAVLPHVESPKIFLAGSPLFFPYLKITDLIEKAGMFIAADDLCSSERLFHAVTYKEVSEYGLFEAIADRYLLPCKCPTFADTEQKANNILEIMRNYGINALIYHVLKGCYLFEAESYQLEKLIKKNGFYFIKIETDYSVEDTGNIMARLESFKAMLC